MHEGFRAPKEVLKNQDITPRTETQKKESGGKKFEK